MFMYLAEAFRLGMLFEAEGGKVNARPEHPRLGQDTDPTDTVDLHLHVRIAIGISQIRKMWPPCGVLGVSFYNDCIFVQRICKRKRCFRLLP